MESKSKKDLIEHLAEETQLPVSTCKKFLEATLNGIAKLVDENGRLQLTGFGIFTNVQRKGRTGRNPKTGESIEIEPKVVTKFKATFK